jgi:hypothetical protein
MIPKGQEIFKKRVYREHLFHPLLPLVLHKRRWTQILKLIRIQYSVATTILKLLTASIRFQYRHHNSKVLSVAMIALLGQPLSKASIREVVHTHLLQREVSPFLSPEVSFLRFFRLRPTLLELNLSPSHSRVAPQASPLCKLHLS